jgi:hypothetical protein
MLDHLLDAAESNEVAKSALIVDFATIWGAAAYAHRINGTYLKEPQEITTDSGTTTKIPNRVIMLQVIKDNVALDSEDLDLGARARNWHLRDITFKSLAGKLTNFEQAMIQSLNLQEFDLHRDRFDFSVVASLIQSYFNGSRLEEAQKLFDKDAPPPGAVGDRLELVVDVLTAIYSKNYNVYFMNAITTSNQMVFFSYRYRLPPGERYNIRCTLKAIKEDKIVQLSRVKLIDQ